MRIHFERHWSTWKAYQRACRMPNSVVTSTTMTKQQDVDTATFVLLTSLPDNFRGLWHTTEELVNHLQDGGITGMDRKTVAKAMRADGVVFSRNRYNQTTYFMLGEPIKRGWSPKLQMLRDNEEMSFLPHMPSDYFKKQDERQRRRSVGDVATVTIPATPLLIVRSLTRVRLRSDKRNNPLL